ncbi:right-handed parallel beta-helix repeat-containing protein [Klebsiella pneumoniae]|uniref:right-handed parallel beta-helix repeat-containing protein n=1 Tax=Klebsiella pneumoniae TaxID=573 RepID=UPI0016531C97|nr:right-handed parallel beta-helix repeat-containing protein [Klebsiella pneumoniae]
MPFYLTRDPVPSADMRNVFDNAQNLDLALNDITSSFWSDRLGRSRMSWFGLESAFTVKLSDFESRFSTQIVEQEGIFESSQTDKENRFQQFLLSSGYVFLGDYENGPFQFSARNQYIRYNDQYYRLNATTDVGFTTTGTDATSFANDVTHFVLMDGDTLRSNLASDEEGLGADLVNTVLDVSVGKYIQNSSPRISDYKVTKGADATLAFAKAFAKAAETTGVVIVDVSCVVDTIAVPSEITIRIADYKTVTHKANASAHMFILPSDSLIKANNKKGRLRGNSANQSAIRRCISAVGVSNAGVDGVDIRDFNSYGAYFENCEDTFCKNSTIRDITGGAVETAAGQYVTNCLRHESAFNDIRDTGSNGIKFRADTLGQTQGCSSTNDKVYRAGFIGIANGKCKDHTVTNAYCESCVDNGCDMNGCYNTRFIDCVSVGCQDGFYMGENGIDNCHIINPTARNCKRSGVGSLGSLTRCSVINPTIDACGSGIYCSGFVGFKIRDGSITNSVKQTYTDNETGTVKTSTGNGIDLQSNLSGCYQPDISGTTFYGNAGYDIAFGSSGTIGNLMLGECSFQDSAGDGKISYGGATLADPQIRNSQGYIVSRTQVYNLAGNGTTLDFTLSLPQAVADANYRIVSVVPDWLTTIRYLDNTKGTSYFIISFGTAPPSGTRRVNISFERLRPV